MSTAPLLTCRNLVKRFGDVAAVQDVSFSVDSGEIFGLLPTLAAGFE